MKKALFAAALAVATTGAALTVPAMAQMNHDAPGSRGHGDQMGQGAMHRPDRMAGKNHRHCRTVWRHHHRVRTCR